MPLIHKEIMPDGVITLIWRTEESESDLISQIKCFDCYEEKFSAIKSASRRLEFLVVRLLVSLFSPGSQVSYLNSGRPYLNDNNYNISISHSKQFVAVMLSPTSRVAIDIECISEKAARLSSRFLSPCELPAQGLSDENAKLYSVISWSAKESVFKYIDRVGVDFLRHIVFDPFTFDSHVIRVLVCSDGEEPSSLDVNFRIYDDFVMTYII